MMLVKIIEQMKMRGVVPKAVLYARFSSDNQRDESIDAQLRAMTKFCQDNEVVMVGEYVDRAKSATTDDRPEFLRMISDAEQKNFNIVLVHKLDRFARNRFDSSNYRNKLKKQNVSLVSVLENLDDSPESIIMESLLDGMAEYYSKNLAREVRKGHNENALQCKHNGGRPPFGFKVNPETQCYEIDENEAEAVRYIFNSISEGKSYNAVIADLNAKGFRTRSGNLFGKNSLYDMLHNEKYKGVYIYNRRAAKDADGKFNSRLNKFDDEIIRIEGGMPRIIDDELFESVNKIITSRKRLKSYGGSTQKYLLTGRIFCGNCGSAYCGGIRYSGKKHTPYVSYTCSSKQRQAGVKCRTKEIRREYIENFVLNEILRAILSDENIPRIVSYYQDFCTRQNKSAINEMTLLSDKLDDCEGRIKNLVSVISKSGNVSLISALEEAEAEKVQLLSDIAKTEKNTKASVLTEDEITEAYKRARKLFADTSTEQKRQLINLYLDKVLIFDDYVEVYVNTLPITIRERLIKSFKKRERIKLLACEKSYDFYHTIDPKSIAEFSSRGRGNKKVRKQAFLKPVADFSGRGDGIRTHGLFVPNEALYQTEPHLDNFNG